MTLTIVGILISFNIALLFIVMIVDIDIYCFFFIQSIYTLQLPEWQGAPSLKHARFLKLK